MRYKAEARELLSAIEAYKGIGFSGAIKRVLAQERPEIIMVHPCHILFAEEIVNKFFIVNHYSYSQVYNEQRGNDMGNAAARRIARKLASMTDTRELLPEATRHISAQSAMDLFRDQPQRDQRISSLRRRMAEEVSIPRWLADNEEDLGFELPQPGPRCNCPECTARRIREEDNIVSPTELERIAEAVQDIQRYRVSGWAPGVDYQYTFRANETIEIEPEPQGPTLNWNGTTYLWNRIPDEED